MDTGASDDGARLHAAEPSRNAMATRRTRDGMDAAGECELDSQAIWQTTRCARALTRASMANPCEPLLTHFNMSNGA